MSIESKIFRPIMEFISINKMDFNGSTMVESYLTAMTLATMPDVDSEFVDELIGKSFKINNPNATSSCGCGVSFSM